jgi:nicotinate-nucleotide adenylyltransferase
MIRPLAILGGTFDPIHFGHLRSAWDAAEALDADVRLVPSNVPPHRPQPRASAAQRTRMLELALAGQDRLTIDRRELEREGASYTIDTLIALREEIGARRSLVLLLGADAFAGLPSWKRWAELFDHAHIGVLTRPGHEDSWPAKLADAVSNREVHGAASLSGVPSGLVARIAVTPLEISASAIRALLATGHEPRYLVPDAVLEYARSEGVY